MLLSGDLSTSGSFESGVGASVSRSIDDGTAVDGTSKSPPGTRAGPPPLTAVGGTPKSQSLDTGLDKERREAGGSADSEVVGGDMRNLWREFCFRFLITIFLQSSGGFSENQNFDESSTGAERG